MTALPAPDLTERQCGRHRVTAEIAGAQHLLLSILKAAEAVFAEKGYEKAKVAQIARRAGVAEGSIYDYFENKENLLISISSHRLTALTRQLTAPPDSTSPLSRLRRFLRLHFSIFLKKYVDLPIIRSERPDKEGFDLLSIHQFKN